MTENNQTSKQTIFSLFKDAVLGRQQDFTTGSIRKAIFLLAIPI